MTGRQLTVHNASVTTMTVEVKTLTIGARQVTQGIFKQLIEEPLIAEDGTLNGAPWGHVTWHPDKCGDDRPHLHIVWQRGAELLRSRVDIEPRFPLFECAEYGEWAMARTLETLRSGGPVDLYRKHGGLLKGGADCAFTSYLSAARIETVRQVKVGFSLTTEAHEAALRQRNFHRLSGSSYLAATYEREAEKALADFAATVEHADPEVLYARALEAIGPEADRQQRHRDVRAQLAALPQLFIGG